MEDHAGGIMARPGSVPYHPHLHSIVQNLDVGTQLDCKWGWEIQSSHMPGNSMHG